MISHMYEKIGLRAQNSTVTLDLIVITIWVGHLKYLIQTINTFLFLFHFFFNNHNQTKGVRYNLADASLFRNIIHIYHYTC